MQGRERAASRNVQFSKNMKIVTKEVSLTLCFVLTLLCEHQTTAMPLFQKLPLVVLEEVLLTFGKATLHPLQPCWQRLS